MSLKLPISDPLINGCVDGSMLFSSIQGIHTYYYLLVYVSPDHYTENRFLRRTGISNKF